MIKKYMIAFLFALVSCGPQSPDETGEGEATDGAAEKTQAQDGAGPKNGDLAWTPGSSKAPEEEEEGTPPASSPSAQPAPEGSPASRPQLSGILEPAKQAQVLEQISSKTYQAEVDVFWGLLTILEEDVQVEVKVAHKLISEDEDSSYQQLVRLTSLDAQTPGEFCVLRWDVHVYSPIENTYNVRAGRTEKIRLGDSLHIGDMSSIDRFLTYHSAGESLDITGKKLGSDQIFDVEKFTCQVVDKPALSFDFLCEYCGYSLNSNGACTKPVSTL